MAVGRGDRGVVKSAYDENTGGMDRDEMTFGETVVARAPDSRRPFTLSTAVIRTRRTAEWEKSELDLPPSD